MPLASETSMGAMEPKKREGKNEETSDILASLFGSIEMAQV